MDPAPSKPLSPPHLGCISVAAHLNLTATAPCPGRTAKWAASTEADAQEQALLDERRDALTKAPVSVRCKGGPPATTTTIPLFWLRALRASESACLSVARRDERALAALADVRLKW
jgi:hypothetical protein